jgi:hypothetical protein
MELDVEREARPLSRKTWRQQCNRADFDLDARIRARFFALIGFFLIHLSPDSRVLLPHSRTSPQITIGL